MSVYSSPRVCEPVALAQGGLDHCILSARTKTDRQAVVQHVRSEVDLLVPPREPSCSYTTLSVLA